MKNTNLLIVILVAVIVIFLLCGCTVEATPSGYTGPEEELGKGSCKECKDSTTESCFHDPRYGYFCAKDCNKTGCKAGHKCIPGCFPNCPIIPPHTKWPPKCMKECKVGSDCPKGEGCYRDGVCSRFA